MSGSIDFGIDLGTTNSSIACCRGGEVRIFQTTELMTVTPSVVYIGKSGRMLVGKRAYDAWPSDPENTQAEFKRWMGFSDTLLFPASNRRMSAEELSAEVLKALRADVQRATAEDVKSCVITVPAAFGVLQCEATGRAAKLAGLEEAPLLQEPIAAAIAYGAASMGAKAQRWIVFDLGGGTLDIAVVSTRNGRLAVLEHQGNNRLGGKDIDRTIVEQLLLPALAERFQLPDRQQQPTRFDRLFRSLVRIAEQAKIALSTTDSVPADIFNVGEDLAGAPIELSLPLTRGELETKLAPLMDNCLDLTRRALEGARLTPADVDRVILVGGPTQMPIVRAALVSLLGSKLEYSIDPMTVVARGAALYASTLESTIAAAAPAAAKPVAAKTVALSLKHERASGTARSPVAGSVPARSGVHEVKIDAAGGEWSSGWIALANDRFVTEVVLAPGKSVTQFSIGGRTVTGAAVALAPAEFSIAFMLPMGAPPLPHTLAIELASEDGSESFDPVFKRHTPLPAEVTKTYRADRALRPSEIGATLPIKFWEVDVSDDPQEKWWAGCVQIKASKLKRPLMEGAEISLTIKIDTSRKLTIEAFIPALNQGFTHDVYVPDPPSTRDQLSQQLELCFERLARVMQIIYAADREDLRSRAEAMQLKLEALAERIAAEKNRGGDRDPDAVLEPSEFLRQVRMSITQMEEQLEVEKQDSPLVIKLRGDLRWTSQVVRMHGSQADKDTLERLSGQFERYRAAADARGLHFVEEELGQLRSSILVGQQWFFENHLEVLQQPGRRFLNQGQAQEWLTKAQDARARNDFPALRQAVNQLWQLQPPDQVEAAKDQAMRSGLKGS